VKRYESIVQFHTPDGKQGNSTIEVNKPLELNGWKIYQNSYDSNLGKWSPVSTLQLVYDPWKKLVYIGFLMILAGSFLMIVQRRKN